MVILFYLKLCSTLISKQFDIITIMSVFFFDMILFFIE